MDDSKLEHSAVTEKKSQSNVKSKSTRRRIYPVFLCILLVGGGIWLWKEVIEDRVIPKRFGVVHQGLIYRSGRISATLIKKTLVKHNIRVIVDLTHDEPENADQQVEKRAAAELNIKRLVFPLKGDGTGDINNYAKAIAAIVEAKRNNTPVLVHCAAGAQRTGGVIAAYRLLVERKSCSFVLEELADYNWDPEDDTILLDYLNNHMAELARLIKQERVIDEVPSPLPKLHVKNKR